MSGLARAQDPRGLRLGLPARPRQGPRPRARPPRLRPPQGGPGHHRQERHRQEPHPAGPRPARLPAADLRPLRPLRRPPRRPLRRPRRRHLPHAASSAGPRPDLLVIDDVGLGQVKKRDDEPTAAHTLFNLIDRRHGRASTAITSNIKLSAWGRYLGDATLAAAILDRLAMRAIRIDIDGPSYRQHVARDRAKKRGTKLPDDAAETDAGTSADQ